ncbi:MAG: class I SAM-dependent methyltransferase [Pleomorphochaeta sp.]
MSDIENKSRFTSRVENYVKYRPSYPQDAINYLFLNGINKKSVVGDIGSGTGILSKLLIDRVEKLYCVEPNLAMRDYANKMLSNNNNFYSIDASAENTTLSDNQLDVITVAQAFHWFDLEKCKSEFNRILKPNSKTFLLFNNRLSNTSFLEKYDDILINFSKDYKKVNHQNLGKDEFNFFFDKKWEKVSYNNFQIFNLEQFIGRVASSSYTPEKGDTNYEIFYSEIKRIFEEENVDGFVRFNYKTEIISST